MKKSNFLEGPILPSLLNFAIPVILALFIQALYSAVDLWAVGKFASPFHMSAVSTSSQVMLIVTSFITGISMGSTILLGRKIGSKNFKEASLIFGGSFWILGILTIFFTILLGFFPKQIAFLANAPKEAFKETVSYLRICGFGTIFIVSYNGISAIFRGAGNSKLPLLFVSIASIFNIIGDIILIKFFNLGATGAAISTVFAQSISVLLSLIYIKKYNFGFKIKSQDFKINKKIITNILSIGYPIAILQMCNEIYYFILMSFVNKLGVIASAGVGVAEKLIVFLILIPLAFMSSISSFFSFNIGAGNKKRAIKGMLEGMILSSILGTLLAYTLFKYGSSLSLIFNKEEEVVRISGTFLKATSLECLILSLVYCFTGFFNGIGKTKFVMLQGLFVIFIVKIPYAFFAMTKTSKELIHLGISTVIGALFSLIFCLAFYIYLWHFGEINYEKTKKQLKKEKYKNKVFQS